MKTTRTNLDICLLAALSVILASACSDQATTGLGPGKGPLTIKAGTDLDGLHPEERQFREVTQNVPSLGGYFFDTASGNLVLQLKNLADSNASLGLVRSSLAHALAEARRRHPGADIIVREVTYTWLQLKEWRDRLLLGRIFAVPGVEWIDLDEERNRVVIGFHSGADPRPIRDVVGSLGVPQQVVELDESGPLELDARTLSDSFRPAPGGVQLQEFWGCINNSCTGIQLTLGFNALWQSKSVFLTSAHGSFQAGALDSTSVYQPYFDPTGTDLVTRLVGFEIADSATFCPWGGQLCSPADASVYQSSDSSAWILGRIARTQIACYGSGCDTSVVPGLATIDSEKPYFVITATQASFVPGQAVFHTGITTGMEEGFVKSLCVDQDEGSYVVTCQVTTNYQRGEGDSGGPVWLDWDSADDSTVTLGGVHVGAQRIKGKFYGVFSPWSAIITNYPSLTAF